MKNLAAKFGESEWFRVIDKDKLKSVETNENY